MTTEKYVIFSDVHGRRDRVRELISRHRDATAFLFLGDGLSDLPEAEAPILSVRGNCDFTLDKTTPEECMLDLGTGKILLMHGHRLGVKSGIERALHYASERGAVALLYGHTHVREERYLPEGTEIFFGERLPRPMWVFNPGSLGNPPDGIPSYGLLQIRGGQMLFSHGTL